MTSKGPQYGYSSFAMVGLPNSTSTGKLSKTKRKPAKKRTGTGLPRTNFMEKNNSELNPLVLDNSTVDSVHGVESDLEENVERLCDYLSQDDQINQSLNDQTISEIVGNRTSNSEDTISTPISTDRSSRRRLTGQTSVSSATSSSCRDPQSPVLFGTTMSEHRRIDGKPPSPREYRQIPDFLNIPPPPHPPEDSPSEQSSPSEARHSRPQPPQAPLPPLPRPGVEHADSSNNMYESHYEEATPVNVRDPRLLAQNNGYEIANGQRQSMTPTNHAHSNQLRSMGHPASGILERNPDTGSYYIASGHTTMSSVSPQSGGKAEVIAYQNRNGSKQYSMLQSAGTTVPINVMPLRPDYTGSTTRSVKSMKHQQQQHQQLLMGTPGLRPSREPNSKSAPAKCCTWKRLALILAILLMLLLVVLMIMMASSSSATPEPSVIYSNQRQLLNPDASQQPTSQTLSKEQLARLRPLPTQFELGDQIVADLLGWRLAYTSFAVQSASNISFNVSIGPSTNLLIYGARTRRPTPAQYEFYRKLNGAKLQHNRLMKRSASSGKLPGTTFVETLPSGGQWHLGFLLDDDQVRPVTFSAALVPFSSPNSGSSGSDCLFGCYGKGVCVDGLCECRNGYTGRYCEESVCPVLCSGQGVFSSGRCHCERGWKGADCDVPSNVCEHPHCGGHGQCSPSSGLCVCDPGWHGESCTSRECAVSDCSGHGQCVQGVCYCLFGWRGDSCEKPYTSQEMCPQIEDNSSEVSPCTSHGLWDAVTKQCVCNLGWTGSRCAEETCANDCHQNGVCVKGECACHDGFHGEHCELVSCLPGCEQHGTCDSGRCTCQQGWTGENCQIASCPKMCSEHGECRRRDDGTDYCHCTRGYTALDCSVPVELNCGDAEDNDNDGMTDCEDSDCCASRRCWSHMRCDLNGVGDPVQVLKMQQSSSPQRNFLERMQFLLRRNSVQLHQLDHAFNQSSASVLRGRILDPNGSPILKVRVGDYADNKIGITTSRPNGWFDLMVNGGASVTLELSRQFFNATYVTVHVPVNEIVRVPDITMQWKADKSEPHATVNDHMTESCSLVWQAHRPTIQLLPSWKLSRFTAGPATKGNTRILAGAGTLVNTLPLYAMHENLYLTYSSTMFGGHKSIMDIQMCGPKPDPKMRLVRLRVEVAGRDFEKQFSAQPNLTHTFSWDKRDVYGQKMFGLVPVTVSISYRYADCDEWLTTRMKSEMDAFRIGKGDVFGWHLSIRHHLNLPGGVLERGDGSVVYLNDSTPVMSTLVGQSQARPLQCTGSCSDQSASSSSLFQPMAVAADSMDNLYIGDYNLIRRIDKATGMISTVLELSNSDTSHEYYLAVHPISNELYISLPLRRQIWKIPNRDQSQTHMSTRELGSTAHSQMINKQHKVVVGTGEPCGQSHSCGDNGPAELALLSHPKGITFDAAGNLYVADERKIRKVTHGSTVISTLLDGARSGAWSCVTDQSLSKWQLRWPTSLSFDLLNDNLLVLDSELVIAINERAKSGRVLVGAPSHCTVLHDKHNRTRRVQSLTGPQAIVWHQKFGILVAETDNRRMHRVRAFDLLRDGKVKWVFGKEQGCTCDRLHCPCDKDGQKEVPATQAHMNSPVALAVNSHGEVLVADQGNLRVRVIKQSSVEWNETSGYYHVTDPDQNEQYRFNSVGQHVATVNLITDQTIYEFTYKDVVYYASLTKVTHNRQELKLSEQPSLDQMIISNSLDQHSIVHAKRLSTNAILERFESGDGQNTRFEYNAYDADSLLMTARINPDGGTWFHDYNEFGRLRRSISPSGHVYDLRHKLQSNGLRTELLVDNRSIESFELADDLISVYSHDPSTDQCSLVRRLHLQHTTIQLDQTSVRTQLDSRSSSLRDDSTVSLVKHKLTIRAHNQIGDSGDADNDDLSLRMDWRVNVRQQKMDMGRRQLKVVGRRIRINGHAQLTIVYDELKNVDMILDKNNDKLLTVHYDQDGSVKLWEPFNQDLAPMNVTYDRGGKLESYTWADRHTEYLYDGEQRLKHQSMQSGVLLSMRKYEYNSPKHSMPSLVTVPSGVQYKVLYTGSGALSAIVTPTTDQHSFATLQSIGKTLHLRYVPGVSRPFVSSFDSDNRLLMIVSPSEQSRVTLQRNAHGQLTNQWMDGQMIETRYNQQYPRSRIAPWQTQRWHRRGPLVAQLIDSHDPSYFSNLKLDKDTHKAEVQFNYAYDELMRMQRVQLSLNDELSGGELELGYDPISGRLKSLRGFEISYTKGTHAQVRIHGNDAIIDDLFVVKRQLSISKLTVKGRGVSKHELKYDSRGRVNFTLIKMNGNGEMETTYMYNADGALSQQVVRSSFSAEPMTWTVHYDLDGRIKQINDRVVTIKNGRVQSVADLVYKWTTDGNLIQRGVFDLSYAYDTLNRLIMRASTKRVQHLYYALPHKPKLLTHIYDTNDKQMRYLSYDWYDRLFAVDHGSVKYFVVLDAVGTPIVWFSEHGALHKRVLTDPLGAVVTDTNPAFDMLVGYRGNIQDSETGVVFVNGRPLGTETGRFMSVSLTDIAESSQKIDVFVPEMVDVYGQRSKQDILGISPEKLTVHDWLRLTGIDLSVTIPLLDINQSPIDFNLNQPISELCATSRPIIIGAECHIRSKSRSLHRLLSMPESVLKPELSHYPSWAALPSPVGHGILWLNNTGSAATILKSRIVSILPSEFSKLAQLLNDSQSVLIGQSQFPSRDSPELIDRFDLFRSINLETDLANLALKLPAKLTENVNLSQIVISGTEESVWHLRSEHLLIVIHFGVENSQNWIENQQQSRETEIEKRLWAAETAKLDQHLDSSRWSTSEIDELRKTGRIAGYLPQLRPFQPTYPLIRHDLNFWSLVHETMLLI